MLDQSSFVTGREAIEKSLSLIYRWCPKIAAKDWMTRAQTASLLWLQEVLISHVNVHFVHVEHNEITSAPFRVHGKCDCGPPGPFLCADRWQKLSWLQDPKS